MSRMRPGPGGPGGGPGRKGPGVIPPGTKIDGKTVKRLLAYVGRNKVLLAIVVICIILSSAASVAGGLFTQVLVDDYISPMLLTYVPGAEAAGFFNGLLKAILFMAMIYAVTVSMTFTYNWLMVRVAHNTLRQIRNDMFEKMQTLPVRYFDANPRGDIMSRFTNDADTLRQMITQSLPSAVSSIITVVAVFFGMLSINIPLTAFVLLFVLATTTLTKPIAKNSAKYFVKHQGALGAVNGNIEEIINGQKVVKVFCHEDAAKEEFDKLNDELEHNAYSANKFANIFFPIMGNFGNVLYVMVAFLGGFMAIKWNAVSLGAVVSFLGLSRSFAMPINHLSQQISSVVMALAGASRIFELMDQEPEADEGYVTLVNVTYDEDGNIHETDAKTGHWAWRHPHQATGEVTYTPLAGDIRMHEVDFGYVPEKQVLYDISLYAEPGQKVAFVGATGAGKTTITNLLNRFYDIADGKVRYDGININKIKKDDLRKSLGMVLQDVNLFTGTVMDNIRYGRLDATDEECIEAAKLAHAHDFIELLPEGYNTMLTSNGNNLSQGQRQLLSIARVAVADPPVMILDEATSSIDTRTEAIVQRGMDNLMKGRTVFVIAHRLSTVQNSDVIMVLDQGHIIERGSHDSLIAEKGNYYKLYTGAFELE